MDAPFIRIFATSLSGRARSVFMAAMSLASTSRVEMKTRSVGSTAFDLSRGMDARDMAPLTTALSSGSRM